MTDATRNHDSAPSRDFTMGMRGSSHALAFYSRQKQCAAEIPGVWACFARAEPPTRVADAIHPARGSNKFGLPRPRIAVASHSVPFRLAKWLATLVASDNLARQPSDQALPITIQIVALLVWIADTTHVINAS